MTNDKPTNELAQASSAYLRSAARQPVRWQEWGEAAFEKAREEDKPVLLDIGAVWCHWCHVMDRESYENEEIARIINEYYVPVKVDRDERPDIDARYQSAVSALTGQGGWPLTAFLTPQGKPFYGGTYFPPDDGYGRPGMKHILETIAQNYQARKDEIFSSAEQISTALGGIEKYQKEGRGADRAVVDSIITSLAGMYDPRHGGFGAEPKFPHPNAIDLLLDAYLDTRQASLLTLVTTTLEHMGRGGVYDQIGGGFHRYSVDERWRVPHFEKMSYDNAGLLVNYLRAYQITGNEFFREIAGGILSFVETVLSSPEGGFFSSQDADASLEDDGDYFTWTLDEVRATLGRDEAEVVRQYYHIEPRGPMHHNPAKNVLFIDQPIEAIAARLSVKPEEVEKILSTARAEMRAAREKRPTPFVDETIYSSWNGMMISALLEGYKVLGCDSARGLALRALDLLLSKAYDPARGVAHSVVRSPADGSSSSFEFRVSNFDLLDDQVFITGALLDAYEVTGKRGYFDRALELMGTTVRRFWDEPGGGFLDTAKDLDRRPGNLATTRKPFQDSPTPAGNSVAVLALDRLAVLAGRQDFREKAKTTLDLFAPLAADSGLFAATYALALVNHLRPAVEIVVVGNAQDDRAKRLLKAAYGAPRAGKRVLALEPAALSARDLPAGLAATLPNLPLDGNPLALVCVGTACQPPARSPEELTATLSQ